MFTNGRTNGQTIGSLYRAMPEAGATKKEFSRVNSILKYEYLIELLDF